MSYKWEDLQPLRQKQLSQYQPEEQQLLEYAEYIGLELPQDAHLMYLAKEGIKSHLPKEWQACQTHDGNIVYRNNINKIIQEEHPLDSIYIEKVKLIKQQSNSQDYEQEVSDYTNKLSEIQEDQEQSLKNQSEVYQKCSYTNHLLLPNSNHFPNSNLLLPLPYKNHNRQISRKLLFNGSSNRKPAQQGEEMEQNIWNSKLDQKIDNYSRSNHEKASEEEQEADVNFEHILPSSMFNQQLQSQLYNQLQSQQINQLQSQQINKQHSQQINRKQKIKINSKEASSKEVNRNNLNFIFQKIDTDLTIKDDEHSKQLFNLDKKAQKFKQPVKSLEELKKQLQMLNQQEMLKQALLKQIQSSNQKELAKLKKIVMKNRHREKKQSKNDKKKEMQEC